MELSVSLWPPLVAALVSLVGTYVLIALLPRLGLLDTPNRRSSHDRPVPRGGGVAVLCGVASGLLVAGLPKETEGVLLLAAAAGMLGLMDDRWSLSVRSRLVAQVLLAVLGGLSLALTSSLGTAAVIGLAFLWVAFVNAFNFMDGINGISALVAIVAAGWFVLMAHPDLQVLGWVVGAAVVGFLVFNAAGRIFLGDIGSYSLGSLLWSMTALLLASGSGVVESVAPMSLYALETATAVAVLVLSGGRPGQAHRLHAYQRLVDLGFPHLGVALVTATTLSAMLGIVWTVSPAWFAVLLAVTVGVAYIGSPALFGRTGVRRTEAASRLGSG